MRLAVAAAGLVTFAALAGAAIGALLHAVQHQHQADPDLSAYVGVPACPCGTFAWDEEA